MTQKVNLAYIQTFFKTPEHSLTLSVVIGLQQTAYTVTEADEQQLVCFEVLSGHVNGREFVIDYDTISGTASKLLEYYYNCGYFPFRVS